MQQTLIFLSLFLGSYRDFGWNHANPIEIDQLPDKIVVVSESVTQHKLRFVPRALGTTTITVKDKKFGKVLRQFVITVNDPALQVIERELHETLEEIDGVKIRIAAGKVLLDGQVLTIKDYKKCYSAAKIYGGRVQNLVTLNPDYQAKLAKIIERQIGAAEIRVTIVNGHILLEGSANSAQEAERAEIIAQMYAPDLQISEAEADRKVISRHPN
jgi:hypothetical protein